MPIIDNAVYICVRLRANENATRRPNATTATFSTSYAMPFHLSRNKHAKQDAGSSMTGVQIKEIHKIISLGHFSICKWYIRTTRKQQHTTRDRGSGDNLTSTAILRTECFSQSETLFCPH